MAELSSQNVVNHSQSVGDASSTDVPATTLQSISTPGEADGVVAKENGLHSDEQVLLEESTAKSDTDTSRDARSADTRPAKKASIAAKPVAFAKYSVPKVIAANAAKQPIEKQSFSPITAPQPLAGGRPRLVAKTTSSLSTKVKPFKTTAPDPMQVWNKNRITPQPSTKNLTDEELKQQYGIHLTSRLQSDGEGKESKWADIDDDDEDDWAPETIEWGDGTKTTVNPETAPAIKSATASKPSTPATETPKPILESKPSNTFSTSIGPNAKVLKIGARAETQAQKTAQSPKGSSEKTNNSVNVSAPAPVPSKSPWAKLPPVEKVSPVEIKPQNPFDAAAAGSHGLPNTNISAPSAQEISADSFNRAWRDSAQPQLFMPNSGRYESVPENRRRMSRNDGFRAPAVLQRPGHNDMSAPEPSPAFQTTRTSSDARRRASSTVSGDAAQMIRRMSIKSGENIQSVAGSAIVDSNDQASVTASTPAVTPAYQARGGDYVATPGQSDAELESQRKQQRQLMREQAELARKRRLEDEARLEAEKQERIRQKLLSLGPDPKIAKAEQEARAKAEAEAKAKEDAEKVEKEVKDEPKPALAVVSPPKPPQPTATGEPQQYGMMKVHPLDSVKNARSTGSAQSPRSVPAPQRLEPAVVATEDISPEPPLAEINGLTGDADPIKPSESGPVPEPIPRNRPVVEVRSNWARNDHRGQPASSLWGPPHNKALGNGTFDQTLAGYAPQDLSSRASSVGGWMNGKTPTVGQSPQLGHITQHVPETRSQALQNMTSPEPLPLSMNSEVDSLQPVRPPAPIGPPQIHQHQPVQPQQSPVVNGFSAQHANPATASWHNFHNVARVQERAEYEQFQREQALNREEEKRAGIRPQANYTFDETYKHVQLGATPDQRHVTSIAQTNLPPSTFFGAVGSMPPSTIGAQSNRGSRFFPQNANGTPAIQPRAVTYSYIEVPRSPSPPPAEEIESSHPAYIIDSPIPRIRLPPEKAVVKLPPARPPTPPAPTPPPAPVVVQPAMPAQPLTWAARAAMPPPKPAPPLRAVSQPIVKNPSWQERFNGLLDRGGRKPSDAALTQNAVPKISQPALAVTSASKEPLDVMPEVSVFVSLPGNKSAVTATETTFTTKDVENEEDLFEDREAGSLPALYFPSDAPAITWPRAIPSRVLSTPPDAQTQFTYMAPPWKEDRNSKPQFAIIRAPGSEQSVKKDLPVKNGAAASTSNYRSPLSSSTRHTGTGPARRGFRGGKARTPTVKAQ